MIPLSIPASDVRARRALRHQSLLSLYRHANGCPSERIDTVALAGDIGGQPHEIMTQLLVLENLGLATDVDHSGASITGTGVLLAERLLLGEA